MELRDRIRDCAASLAAEVGLTIEDVAKCRRRPVSAFIRREMSAGSLLPAVVPGGQRGFNRVADAELMSLFSWSAAG
jgi:hypothetical protein